MNIERINDNTIKFFVSNQDIEERGFTVTDIWQNRQRGEQLLWELLDEVQDEIEMDFVGALKIHVDASDLGMEFTIQISQFELSQIDGQKLIEDEDEDVYQEVELTSSISVGEINERKEDTRVFVFENFEDVIRLFSCDLMQLSEASIYFYNNQYYMCLKISDEIEGKKAEGILGLILEFACTSNVSEAIMEAYGSTVVKNSAYEVINKYFNNHA